MCVHAVGPRPQRRALGRSFVELVRACGIREDLRGSTQKGYVRSDQPLPKKCACTQSARDLNAGPSAVASSNSCARVESARTYEVRPRKATSDLTNHYLRNVRARSRPATSTQGPRP